ncbi:hypothetical protein BGX28_006685 [Mortierella sp. GBA30]|nr:hypothetical protein BGX28_006685 [Mortierella sp. GBA30]
MDTTVDIPSDVNTTPDIVPPSILGSASGPWTTAEIVYVSISGILVCMAFAEIIAFTGSLSYSFIKVHLKAKAAGLRGVQYLSLIVMVTFWILRIFFLGAMLSLVPVPHWQGMATQPKENHQFIPSELIIASQYLAFSLVALLLIMPTVISIYQLMTSPSNVKEQIDAIRTSSTFPRVLIVMPVYNELPEVLHVAICSAIDGDYPKEHLHIFISFDNGSISDLYRALIRNLGVPADEEYYPPVLDLYFRGVQITVSRFPHGGKRLTQKKTFGLINSIYKEYPEKTDHLFVLFIDSDILLHPSTVANFVWDMQLRNNNTDMLGMTGVITVTTKEDMSFINLMQDIEYVHGQFIGRAVESAVGGCVILPGALTIFRYSAFLKVYDEYFAERKVSDLWDFGRSHLGEDRYLTHLLMTKASRPKMIQFCHRATCKTEPVREWRNLMKQRRRWFLGFLTNEGAFLSDPHLWVKYPWLLAFRMIQDIVNGTSMISYVTVVGIATGMQHWSVIWLGLLIAYFFINWGLMFTYGFWLGRYKAMLYPLMFIVGPFVTWFLLVYGVITANERTWGGPRAEAAADKKEEKDLEKGDGDESKDRDGTGRSPRNGALYDVDIDGDEEPLELPDHLFYPDQQQPRSMIRRRRREVGEPANQHMDDSDVQSLELDNINGDALKTVVIERSSGKGYVGSSSNPHKLELSIAQSEGSLSWVDGGDEDTSDSSGDESIYGDESQDGEVDVLDALEEGCGEYFSPRPLGFTSSALLTEDTEWWHDEKHLLSLGILPFVQQPKIPAMFASAETLILTPVIPSAAVVAAMSSRSIKSLSMSLPGSSTASLNGATGRGRDRRSMGTAPSTPKARGRSVTGRGEDTSNTTKRRSSSTPAVPKRRHLSGAASNTLSSRGSRYIPDLPLPPLSRRQSSLSISSNVNLPPSLPLPPGYTPSPQPSFRYIPVEYITPSNSAPASPKIKPMANKSLSAPTTPKLSPMMLGDQPFSISMPASINSTPSPHLFSAAMATHGMRSASVPKIPADILAAALALSSTNAMASSSSSLSSSKRRSRSRIFQTEEAVPPVPAIPYPPPPTVIQNPVPKRSYPTPPLDSSTPSPIPSI